MDGRTLRVYNEDSLADEDLANIRHGSEATDRDVIRELFSQAASNRVVITEDNVAGMTGAVLGEGQGSMMTKGANNRAKSDSKILDLNDALAAAFSSAKQLVIARGVDADLMANKLDIVDQLQSHVATGDAECQAALTEIEGIKLRKRDLLLRVLRCDARVAIKEEWAKKAEKSQSLASGTNRSGSRGQITQHGGAQCRHSCICIHQSQSNEHSRTNSSLGSRG